jgi:hypothetical protein
MHRSDATRVWYVLKSGSALGDTLVWVLAPVYFVTTVGMSPLQLVLVGTFMELTVFVFEVPTGIVADVYSRRLSTVIGFLVIITVARTLEFEMLWFLSITNQADAVGQWTGGPVIGVIGNGFGIRAALVTGAFLLSPAVGLYGRALRRGAREHEIEAVAEATA